MRRLFIYLIVAVLVIGALKAMRHHPARHVPAPPRWHDGGSRTRAVAEARRQAQQAAAEARQALAEAGREARHAYREARDELSRAYREARDEIRDAYREALADRRQDAILPPPPPPAPTAPPALEEAEGLPVPIVPGTRVTEAEARPPAPAQLVSEPQAEAPPCEGTACENPDPGACAARAEARAQGRQAIAGNICATEERARDDARNELRMKVAEWLTPDVPASWTPPAELLDALVVGTKIDPVVKPYGTLYTAELTADFSPRHRAELVESYNRELVQDRLMTLGGILAFVLICLAALSGYIRADEATKGYYTNRLRMLTAAGVGAGGVIVYRLLA